MPVACFSLAAELQVWSLGVMLYLLMYPNFPPFIAGTAQNVAQNTLKYKPEQDPIQY